MNSRAWLNFQLSVASAVVEWDGGENVLRNSEEAVITHKASAGHTCSTTTDCQECFLNLSELRPLFADLNALAAICMSANLQSTRISTKKGKSLLNLENHVQTPKEPQELLRSSSYLVTRRKVTSKGNITLCARLCRCMCGCKHTHVEYMCGCKHTHVEDIGFLRSYLCCFFELESLFGSRLMKQDRPACQ